MTTWAPEIWTGEVRRLLFGLIVKKFGSYSEWEKTALPGRGLDDEFKEFCETFARTVGAKSGSAVQHQICFALPEPENGKGSRWREHAQVAIMCKAAALEMGFISSKHLPELRADAPEEADSFSCVSKPAW
jgi:hypothetical protein